LARFKPKKPAGSYSRPFTPSIKALKWFQITDRSGRRRRLHPAEREFLGWLAEQETTRNARRRRVQFQGQHYCRHSIEWIAAANGYSDTWTCQSLMELAHAGLIDHRQMVEFQRGSKGYRGISLTRLTPAGRELCGVEHWRPNSGQVTRLGNRHRAARLKPFGWGAVRTLSAEELRKDWGSSTELSEYAAEATAYERNAWSGYDPRMRPVDRPRVSEPTHIAAAGVDMVPCSVPLQAPRAETPAAASSPTWSTRSTAGGRSQRDGDLGPGDPLYATLERMAERGGFDLDRALRRHPPPGKDPPD